MEKLELSGIATSAEAPEIIRVPPRDPLPVGRVLSGRYEIRGRLGEGGMGAVYRAHDRELQEDIALKVIVAAHIEDQNAIDRLRHEVKLARQITHPNVCRVFDLGESDGLYFLTMELVEGRTLRQCLAAGRLPPDRALHLLEQIAEGLRAAHAQGIVHGDLKPENVLVREDGRAVVADFGISRKPHLDVAAAPRREGTPAYMSPEQHRGESIDVRSDVFTLGVVGFELLAGQRPFEGDAPAGCSPAIVTEPPPLDVSGFARPVLCALHAVFARALATDSEQRFESAAEFGAALSEARRATAPHSALEGASTPEGIAPRVPVGQPRRKARDWLRRGLVALLVLAAIGFGGWKRLREKTTEPAEARVAIAVLPFENMTHDAQWDAWSRSAPESIAASLRTLPEVSLPEERPADRAQARAQGIVFVISGSVQHTGSGLRLLAQIEPADEADRVPMVEPVEVDADSGHISEALDTLRRRVLDEARLAVRHHEQRWRAIHGTKNDVARAAMLKYDGMVELRPRPEQYEAGLKLLDEALAADGRYVPALVERAYLRVSGAGEGTEGERIARAVADLEMAGKVRPDEPAIAVARCRILQVAAESLPLPTDAALEKATDACQRALSAAPGSAHVHIAIARLHDRVCRDDDAMRALERAVELDPSLSGRALKHLVGLALVNDRMLLAERVSQQLVAFQEQEGRLGPHSVSRRAGAPEARGSYFYRGAVLLRLDRLVEAKDAFERELSELESSSGETWAEAAALRGLERVATAQRSPLISTHIRRLAEIEHDYRTRMQVDPDAADNLVKAYALVDPAVAATWFQSPAPGSCDEAFFRARIHSAAGDDTLARAALAACRPTEQWEKNCAARFSERLTHGAP